MDSRPSRRRFLEVTGAGLGWAGLEQAAALNARSAAEPPDLLEDEPDLLGRENYSEPELPLPRKSGGRT